MTNEQFLSVVKELADSAAVGLVRQWIEREGLPKLCSSVAVSKTENDKWEVRLTVTQSGEPYRLLTHLVVDVDKTRHIRRVEVDGVETESVFTFDAQPTKIEFNALNDIPTANPNFYVWQNLIDDFHDTLIVYGTARQDEANHTLARHWQETLANAYTEILLPLVKDSELTPAQAASHDLIVLGTLIDNRLFASLPSEFPVRFGKNHFEWRGVIHGEPDEGLFLVVPNPFNAKRVMYVVAANSALQLHQMTKQYIREIPSWAVFKGAKIVKQGYHPLAEFQFKVPFGPH